MYVVIWQAWQGVKRVSASFFFLWPKGNQWLGTPVLLFLDTDQTGLARRCDVRLDIPLEKGRMQRVNERTRARSGAIGSGCE